MSQTTEPETPSVKGAALQSIAEDIAAAIDDELLTRGDLESSCTSDEIRTVIEGVDPVEWYPVTTYSKLINVLIEVHAPVNEEAYLRKRGAAALERMLKSGGHKPLAAIDALVSGTRSRDQMLEDVRHLAGIWDSMFSFAEMDADLDVRGNIQIRMHRAMELPDELIHVLIGVFNKVVVMIDPGGLLYEVDASNRDELVFKKV